MKHNISPPPPKETHAKHSSPRRPSIFVGSSPSSWSNEPSLCVHPNSGLSFDLKNFEAKRTTEISEFLRFLRLKKGNTSSWNTKKTKKPSNKTGKKQNHIHIELGRTKTLWAKPCSRFHIDLWRRQRFDSMAISPRNQLLGLVKKTHTHTHLDEAEYITKFNIKAFFGICDFVNAVTGLSKIHEKSWINRFMMSLNTCSPNFITSPYWHCRCHPMSSPKRYKGSCLQKKPAWPMNQSTRLEILGIKDIWDTTITSINLFYGHFGDGIWLFLCSQKQPSNMFQHRQTA